MTIKSVKQLLEENHIFLDVTAKDRYTLIQEVARWLAEDPSVSDCELLAEDAISREDEMPTGINAGIALPHARTPAVNKMILAFARPTEPIDFKSPDGLDADLVFFSAIPPNCVDEYLKTTATLVRFLSRSGVKSKLRSASSVAEVLAVFEE